MSPARLVPCHVVKSLQYIWRSGTRRWNLQWLDFKIVIVIDFKMKFVRVVQILLGGDRTHQFKDFVEIEKNISNT